MLALHRSVTLLLLVFLLQACKEPLKAKDGTIFRTPADYNEYIISRQTKVIRNVMDLFKRMETSPDTALSLLDKYSKVTDTAISDIQGMPPFRTDSAFRDAAIQSFIFYKSLFNNYYRKALLQRTDENTGDEAEVRERLNVMEKIRREEEQLDKKLHQAQNEFARKYDMKMRPSDIQKEIEKKN